MRELDVREVQKRLLWMGSTICALLEKHDIPYIITFGTLLGAVRHGGFIPWDDDFDLFLFDETYGDAVRLLKSELPAELFVEDAESEPRYFHEWTHIKDRNTRTICTQYPQDGIYAHQGLSIDLYRAKLMHEREVELFRLKENLAYQRRKLRAGVLTEQEFLGAERSLQEAIAQERECASLSANDRMVYGMTPNERIMYVDEIFPLQKYRFENMEFYGPRDADAQLTRFYGEYMRLPPEKNRHPHYESVTLLKD